MVPGVVGGRCRLGWVLGVVGGGVGWGGDQWSATLPPSGESGLPSWTQRTRPPLIEWAWKPDARNAWAAISERDPTRQ